MSAEPAERAMNPACFAGTCFYCLTSYLGLAGAQGSPSSPFPLAHSQAGQMI